MNYVKHHKSRLNLGLVHKYEPEETKKITFLGKTANSGLELIESWKFEDEEQRDQALAKLDKITGCAEILEDDKPRKTGFG